MAFIDRFIKIPIQVYNIENHQLTGNKDYEDSSAYILPGEIVEFFPTTSEGSPAVHVIFKNGVSIVAELPLPEFIKLINNHFQS